MARYEHDRRWDSHLLNARTCADVHTVGFFRSGDRMIHRYFAERVSMNGSVRDGYLKLHPYFDRDDRDRGSPWESERKWRCKLAFYPGSRRNRWLKGCRRTLQRRAPVRHGWRDYYSRTHPHRKQWAEWWAKRL